MTLQEQIKNQTIEAMKIRDRVKLDVLRGISTAFMNELVKIGKKPQDTLKDEEAIAVIMRLAKQRKDSIDQFSIGGRDDLVAEEKAQLEIIEKYLPKMMDRGEVEIVVKNKRDELGINDASKKGILMSTVMKDLKGKADGAMVKEVVDSLF